MAPETSNNPFGSRGEKLSIIIPTYNCAQYLKETLVSVKQQPSGSLDEAQIVVLDDCSTKDDPESVVRAVWPERVKFVRQPQNVGPCANFNSCLDHAEREWIHILHGDDFALPGAYAEFAEAIATWPDAIAVFARSVLVDANGLWTAVSPRLAAGWRGRLLYEPEMWAGNRVMFPGALLSRRAIDKVGGFDCSFCHVQDWNLWWRVARTGEAVYTNHCVAGYREFEGNHTSTLVRSGKNLEEIFEQVERVVSSVKEDPAYDARDLTIFYETAYYMAVTQCWFLNGEPEAFDASFRIFQRFPQEFRKRRHLHWIKARHFENLIRRRLSLPRKKFASPLAASKG
jgi:glycosyltransferase involved in cell wall biosynthesis